MSDTPETDAEIERQESRYLRADFASKLERQRDEARREAERWRDNFKHNRTMSMVPGFDLPWESEPTPQ